MVLVQVGNNDWTWCRFILLFLNHINLNLKLLFTQEYFPVKQSTSSNLSVFSGYK